MDHDIQLDKAKIGNIVYVKPVAIDDLPDEIQDEARAQADGGRHALCRAPRGWRAVGFGRGPQACLYTRTRE